MNKVLITGACGYIGARLSKYLAENGYSITAFDSFNPSNYTSWTTLMEDVIIGDIRDETTISDLTKKQFDIAIHLISLDHHKSESEPNIVSSINVMPTWNLLDKLTKNGLKKFIYFSTIHVYGNIPNQIITEDQITKPINAYGLTHLLSENICNYYNEKTETKCINARLSNSYGSPVFEDNNCWWLVINDLCKTAFTKNKIKLLSDGSSQRDFIHISDICRAVYTLLNAKDDFKNNIFHIASGESLTILELAHIIKDIYRNKFNEKSTVFFPDGSLSELPSTFINKNQYHFDISKIQSLGFKTSMDLSNGINELFDYLIRS